LPALVAISALGNIIALAFTAGRRIFALQTVANGQSNKKSPRKVCSHSPVSGLAIDHFELLLLHYYSTGFLVLSLSLDHLPEIRIPSSSIYKATRERVSVFSFVVDYCICNIGRVKIGRLSFIHLFRLH
jgi:hypothetical protein